MLNQDGELIPAHLIQVLGPGIHESIKPVWEYRPGGGGWDPEWILPVNQILRFRTVGHRLALHQPVTAEMSWRVVADRRSDGGLRRAHIHLTGELFAADGGDRLGDGTFWMALTRPFAPAGRRRPDELPEALRSLPEFAYGPDDLPSHGIESYRLGGTAVREHPDRLVFHRDRTDLYQHVNTVVYLDTAQDLVARAAFERGLDAGRMRFREIEVYFRKPFLLGEVAEAVVEVRYVGERDFEACVRLRHRMPDGTSSERISTAVRMSGSLGAGG